MIAVIMAGGSGTRLRPLTSYKPKPMLPILTKPMMEYVVNLLVRHQVKKAVATLYYRPNDIKDYFTDGKDFGIELDYSLEKIPLGTAGSVKLAESKISFNEPVIIISGDALTDFDLEKALKIHEEKKADVTILLKKVKNPLEFGVVVTDEAGWIKKFVEKPGRTEVVSDLVNTGIYIIEPHVLQKIPTDKTYDFAKDLFPKLIRAKSKIYGAVMDGYWADVGDLKQYVQTQIDLMEGKLKFRIPVKMMSEGIWVGDRVEFLGNEKLIKPVFIGNNCRIEQGSTVGPNVILGNNVVVESHARVENSVIMSNSFLGNNSHVNGAILGNGVIVEMGGVVQEGAVVSDDCTLGAHSTVQSDVFIWPAKTVEADSVVTHDLVWSKTHSAAIFADHIVRGLANVRLSPQFAIRLGMSLGAIIGLEKTLVVSRDGSSASRLIKRAFTAGLMSMGVDIIDLQGMACPLSRYAIRALGVNGSCHVRISDEHPEVIQMEFYDKDGFPINRDLQRKVEAVYSRGEFPRVKIDETGELGYRPGFINNYVEEAIRYVDKSLIAMRNFSVVIDYAYGPISQVVARLLEPLGCEVIDLRRFMSVKRTTDNKISSEKISRITKLNADFGVMMHPSGEYFSLIDENGQIYSPEISRLLLVWRKIDLDKENILIPSNWSKAYSELLSKNRSRLVKTKANKGEMIRQASEQLSEHGDWVSFKHFYQDVDGAFSILKILELLAYYNTTLSNLIEQLPKVNVQNQNIKCPWEKMGAVLRKLTKKFDASRIDTHDGIRIQYDNGWCLVLPDSKAPRLIVSAESTSSEESKKLLEHCKNNLEEIIRGEK